MKQLFEKTTINKLELKNRFFRSALWMCMADEQGHLTPSLFNTYRELAEGGVGMILTGYAMVDPNDRPNPGMIGMYDDCFIEENRELVSEVHKKGAAIALQLAYGGSQTFHPEYQNREVWGPSAVTNRVTKVTPKEMTKADISTLIKNFTDASVRAAKAGYDAIQIHAAHGYLLSQFLAPFCNSRKDEYGGSLENRARIVVETIQSIRKAVGPDFPVMIKLNHDDYMDEGEGFTLSEAKQVVKMIEKAGADLIEISGTNETSGKGLGPARPKVNRPELQSYYLTPTTEIAEEVSIPVVLMGGNRQFDRMDSILNTSKIEYFSIGRPLLCEPDLITKWKTKREYKPKCVSCNGCYRDGMVGCVIRERMMSKK